MEPSAIVSGVPRPGAAARGRGARPFARWGVVAVPTVIAAVLGAIDLGGRSLWLDESATFAIAAQHGAALASAMARDGGNMLGYYALIHVLVDWFGSGTVVLRAPSVVGGAATTALVTVLAGRIFAPRVAMAAGVLTAVSLPAVFWEQDARSYALLTAFVAGSYLGFVALIDPRAGGGRGRAWVGYVVATTLALYMSFVAVLVVPAQLASLASSGRRARSVVSALVAVACLAAPLAVLAGARGSGQLFWVPRPGLTVVGQVLVSLTSAGFQPNFHLGATALALEVATLFAFAVALAVLVGRAVADRSSARVWGETVVVAWLVVPFVVALVESVFAQPTFTARNLLVSLPAAAIVLARVVADRRLPRLAGAGLFALFVGLRAAQLAPSYGVSPENWRGATADVLARTEPGDCIAFYPSDGRMAFTYYLDHGAPVSVALPRPVLPTTPLRQVVPYLERYTTLGGAQLGRVAAACPRLWLLSSHEGSPTGPAASVANYRRYVRLEMDLKGLYPRSSVVSFGWASPVRVELFRRPS
ncbi:MAG TPA: glycosyltransferase family 39 protein [Acidimicrobiales bacterium]|nr:glycosyltransferase family 39 protein [Acidimicrobiales bacterium]